MEYTHIVTQVLWNPWPTQHVVRHHTVRMMCSGSNLAKHFQREELIRLHFLKHHSTHFLVPVPVRDGFDGKQEAEVLRIVAFHADKCILPRS